MTEIESVLDAPTLISRKIWMTEKCLNSSWPSQHYTRFTQPLWFYVKSNFSILGVSKTQKNFQNLGIFILTLSIVEFSQKWPKVEFGKRMVVRTFWLSQLSPSSDLFILWIQIMHNLPLLFLLRKFRENDKISDFSSFFREIK